MSASRTFTVDVRQGDVQILHDPGVLVVVGDLELDRERAVRALVVLADEAVGLQPARERGLGAGDARLLLDQVIEVEPVELLDRLRVDRSGGDERALGDLRPMRIQVHPHADLELVDAQPLTGLATLAARLDDMVTGSPRQSCRSRRRTRWTRLRPFDLTATIW